MMTQQKVTLSIEELAVFTQVVLRAINEPIDDIDRLHATLKDMEPNVPFEFAPEELSAAGAACRFAEVISLLNALPLPVKDSFDRLRAKLETAVQLAEAEVST